MKYIITEQQFEEQEDKISKVVQSYLDRSLDNYYGIKRFWVDYNELFHHYVVNIFFDRKLAIEMGGGMNMLMRRATNEIGNDLNSFFNGIDFVFHQHFED